MARRTNRRKNRNDQDLIEVSQGSYAGIPGVRVVIEEADEPDELETLIQGYLDSTDVVAIQFSDPGDGLSAMILFTDDATATARPVQGGMSELTELVGSLRDALELLGARR